MNLSGALLLAAAADAAAAVCGDGGGNGWDGGDGLAPPTFFFSLLLLYSDVLEGTVCGVRRLARGPGPSWRGKTKWDARLRRDHVTPRQRGK